MSVWTRAMQAASSAVAYADDRDDQQCFRGAAEKGGRAGDHVDAGRHHRGGMDQAR